MVIGLKWTKDMEQYLIDNYNKLSIEELAKNIGVTKSSITNKAFSLKITNNTQNKNRGNINLFHKRHDRIEKVMYIYFKLLGNMYIN